MRSSISHSVAFVAAIVVTAVPSAAQTGRLDGERDPQPTKATLAVVNGRIIDGHEGPPLSHGVVLVDGNRIVAVGTMDTLKVPAGAKLVDAGGMTVMPGLIDVHVHMDIIGHTNYPYWHKTYFNRYEDIMTISARQLLMNGVTTVADLCGQPDALIATRKRIETGQIPGPRMRASMGWISNWPDEEWENHHRRRLRGTCTPPTRREPPSRRS